MIKRSKNEKAGLPRRKAGAILILVLVFGSIFVLLMTGLFGFILTQYRHTLQKAAWEQSLHIAEAGINYYRWCLNHEMEESCSLEMDYYDTSGNPLGGFSLTDSSTESCGQTVQREITSIGRTDAYPEAQRAIKILYARTSIAKYSYILNSNVWVGDDHEIRGSYHSNGGIRMDGENQSVVSSASPNGEWICTSSFGCSSCPVDDGCWIDGSDCKCPGVFTTTNNAKPDLFEYPVPSFNFEGITVDLARMKTVAQTGGGVYLEPSINKNPSGKGYHLKFKNNGTFEVWIITGLSPTYAYSLEEGWHYDYFTISREHLYNTYSIPSACSAIFVEDNLWPEGVVKGKVVTASADLLDSNKDTDIVLAGNINYSVKDGSDGLTLLSQRNVLIGPQSPDRMELRGIFVAQKGRFSRNHYWWNFREKLEIYGSIISNGRVGTKWISGSTVVSGYRERESYFDANLVYNPPPFTPFIDEDFKLLRWQEI